MQSTDPQDQYGLLRNSVGEVPADWLSFFLLSGQDAKAWLNGQVTQDLRDLAVGQSCQGCLCSPTGQLEAQLWIWRLETKLIIATERATSQAFAGRVESHVVLEDVEMYPFSGAARIFEGPAASALLSNSTSLPSLDAGIGEDSSYLLRTNWTGHGGWATLGAIADSLECRRVEKGAYELARFEAGVPEFGIDWSAKTLPPELGPDYERKWISYSKGCYTGQEVLMRIHSRGHANRKWMALLSELPIPVGESLAHASRRDAGVVSRSALSPEHGYVSGAMVRDEVALPGESLTSESGIPCVLASLPLLRFD